MISMKMHLVVDPPSGWKYGFPQILVHNATGDMVADLKTVNYSEFLRSFGYPEKDIELALNYSTYWYEED